MLSVGTSCINTKLEGAVLKIQKRLLNSYALWDIRRRMAPREKLHLHFQFRDASLLSAFQRVHLADIKIISVA